MNTYQTADETRTEIEKQMMALPKSKKCSPHKLYVAGLLEGLTQGGVITAETHDELYVEYVG